MRLRNTSGVRACGVIVMAALLSALGCEGASDDRADVTGQADAVQDTQADVPAGLTVLVKHGDDTRTASLAALATVSLEGLPFVRLSEVVGSVFPTLDLSMVTADFMAADGFVPASSPNCTTLIPVDGALLTLGYISPDTRNLAWDDELQYPGCMRVRDTAEIRLADR
ncbi:hypothetical protein KBD49_09705 [Myxococcota bacterium]|nr:hypothetical protein [Myxococcota bacterium]